MSRKIFIVLFIIIAFFHSKVSKAQVVPDEIDSLDLSILDELNFDSLTLIDLIDSLLTMEPPASYISVNTGYISQITSSGRDLEINQFGFNAGLGYFHKSGAYANISGFWYSDFEPSYSLTHLSLGYLGITSKKFAYLLSYDQSFYTQSAIEAYTKSFNTSAIFDLKIVEPYIDYSFYFGNGTAHRLSPGITLDLKITKLPIVKSISFRPTFSMIYGNNTIVNSKLLSSDEDNLARYLRFTPRLQEFLATNPTQEEIDAVLVRFPRAQEFLKLENKNVFGLMNYGISLPVSFNFEKLRLSFNYNYNIPVALPGELFELSPNDYISLSLSYKFKL